MYVPMYVHTFVSEWRGHQKLTTTLKSKENIYPYIYFGSFFQYPYEKFLIFQFLFMEKMSSTSLRADRE
jgi:hypothetical protein